MKRQKLPQSSVRGENGKATLENNSIMPNKTDMNLSRGHDLGKILGDGEGWGGLVHCSPLGHKKSDMTGQLNNNNNCDL